MAAVGAAAGPRPVRLDARRGSTGPAPTRSRWSAARCSPTGAAAAARPASTTSASARYRLAGGDGLEPVGTTYVDTSGRARPSPDLPVADLHLVNAEDLTFAAVRTDERSLRTMLERAGALPDPLSRALAVTTAWDMLVKGELATDDVLGCVLGVLGTERSPGVVEPFLALALRSRRAVDPPARGPGPARAGGRRGRRRWPTTPEHRVPALRTLAAASPPRSTGRCWTRPRPTTSTWPGGSLVRRAALGEYDADAVAALLERDPDPDASVRAVAVRAARPEEDGQGRGVGRAVRAAVGTGRAADPRGGDRLLAPGPARAAAALGAPLPRRGRAARHRRRHARGDVAAARMVPSSATRRTCSAPATSPSAPTRSRSPAAPSSTVSTA